MLSTLINSLIFGLSLSTATGILLHDMHIDKMAMTALSSVVAPHYDASGKLMNLSPDLHTHAERHSLAQVVHDLKAPNPRIQPRTGEDKKHLLQKHAARGHHYFDNYNLPLA